MYIYILNLYIQYIHLSKLCMYIYICVCVLPTGTRPPVPAAMKATGARCFLVVGLEGQQELAIDRCQRVDVYCVLYIDHCKYS